VMEVRSEISVPPRLSVLRFINDARKSDDLMRDIFRLSERRFTKGESGDGSITCVFWNGVCEMTRLSKCLNPDNSDRSVKSPAPNSIFLHSGILAIKCRPSRLGIC